MSARSKTKPSPPAPATDNSADARSAACGPDSDSDSLQDGRSEQSVAASTASTASQGNKWLAGSASWRSKAPAIVKTAAESIAGNRASSTRSLPTESSVKRRRDDSPTKFLTKRKSSKGDAIPASMTKVNVSSDGLVDEPPKPDPEEPPQEAEEPPTPVVDEAPLPPEPSVQQEVPANPWRWRAWWSRPDGYSEADKMKTDTQGSVEAAQSTPLPGATPSEEPDAETKGLGSSAVTSGKSQDVNMTDAPQEAVPGQTSDTAAAKTSTSDPPVEAMSNSSWFRLWSSAQNAGARTLPAALRMNNTSTATLDKSSEPAPEQPADEPAPQDSASSAPESAPTEIASTETAPPVSADAASTKPSAWAFWYRGKANDDSKSTDGKPQKHVGEVAVMDTPSQTHPEAAQFNEQTQPQTPTLPEAQKSTTQEPAKQEPAKEEPAKQEPLAKRSLRSLRGRSKPQNTLNDEPPASSSSSKTNTPTEVSPVLGPTKPETAPVEQAASKQLTKVKQEPPNLILPEFKTTYRLVQQPSFWKQVRQYFLGGEPASPHLHINPAPPRIKKALAIGIHGFFPAPIIQKVLGQPTGTSIRFANAAAAAIKDWSAARGYEPEIEQIALEGEGFIAERVNSLWKLLLNWIEHIKAADFILFACHSQGVPVTMMLVAKLIQFGCVHATRIGVCAMAGVNMGPFIEYKTKYFGPTAAELFEFSNPKSLVSQMYLASLDEVLRFGIRIVYVGSIDDQLVSLESSTFSTLTHPYIYRAVFVDGRIHAPDFLTHLVGFTLKLRNLGLPDHGLIRELSPALAGSLYGGEGHSRVYEDPAVYTLAVQHALETTSLPILPQQRPSTSGSFQGINIPVVGEKVDIKDLYKLRVKEYESSASSTNPNPFFLPWAMRGLLEEDFVKKELGKEVEELLAMFETWKPTGKQLKDVKFRLEAVRSKL